jgi:hypothetical protein
VKELVHFGQSIGKSTILMSPITRITGAPGNGYHTEVWTAMGSCVLCMDTDTAQEAHDAIEALLPGVETHWYVR